MANISRSRGWSMDYIIWGDLSYAAGLRIIWADAVANGQKVVQVYKGEDVLAVSNRESMREAFSSMKVKV